MLIRIYTEFEWHKSEEKYKWKWKIIIILIICNKMIIIFTLLLNLMRKCKSQWLRWDSERSKPRQLQFSPH